MALQRSGRALIPGLLLLAGTSVPCWSDELPEPQAGKALVCFVRTGRMSGAAGSIYLFADRTFAGILPNGSYGYAHLEPGRRLFWTTWTKATRELDLVPGETYYLEVWREITVVDAARGRALIEKVRDLAVPDAGERAKAETYVSKRYDRVVEKEGRREMPPTPAIGSAAAIPDDLEGMVRIPAYTQGILEFMETVTSEFTPSGTPVLFRLVEDVVVDGETVRRAGAIVRGVVGQSSQAGGYGKAGLMEVVVPTLTTEDGVAVPLVAQVVGSGSDTEDAAAAAGLVAGLMGGFAVRGREAFYLAGQRLKVWTREDVWVRRRPSAPSGSSVETQTTPQLEFSAHATSVVHFKPSKGYKPDDVVLVIETAEPLAEASISAVDGFALPQSLAAKSQVHRADGWNCAFDGWGVVRYLRAEQDSTPQQVRLTGRLADGRGFAALAAVQYQVER